MDGLSDPNAALLADFYRGEQRALARVISKIENRDPGYRTLLSELYPQTGATPIVGITGSPGAGKSTLVDTLTKQYRDNDETVGILAVDPSSPYTGGSVLGDRIRMGSAAGDMGVFIRSMSARGTLGGLSMATADALVALDAFGIDRILIETVGAGQNEVDIVETADTVVVVVQPGSGDDIQLLKAGILEIGDLFVVNKADMAEASKTVADLETMIHLQASPDKPGQLGHHGSDTAFDSHAPSDDQNGAADGQTPPEDSDDSSNRTDPTNKTNQSNRIDPWTPPVIETVATTGDGVPALASAIEDHRQYLDRSGESDARSHQRAVATVQRLLQRDLGSLSEQLLTVHGGVDELATAIANRETDPYTVVAEIVDPLESAVGKHRDRSTSESDR